MKKKEFLGLLDLARAEGFCIYELTKIVVVSENEDLILTVFKVVISSLKSLNNS